MQETIISSQGPSWLDRPLLARFVLNWETALFSLLLVIAVLSRFYDLGARVMSHDETSHVYFSWLYSKGNGYAHDPVTHGPLQFHLIGLTYFLFGDNDTTSRIPAALFSVATVYFAWHYRRYLGRAGAIVAALLFTISPYMLYYGRYARNEAFVALFGAVTIWAILRYIETGKPRYLYWLTLATVLHFTAKETSFIYHAQALLFLALYLIFRITDRQWPVPSQRSRFLLALIAALLLFAASGSVQLYNTTNTTPIPSDGSIETAPPLIWPGLSLLLLGAGIFALGTAIYLVLSGYTIGLLRKERSFDLAMLMGTLVLPQLSPFLINALGWKIPVNATEVRALEIVDFLKMGSILFLVLLISIGLGLWWNRRQWSINAAIWYSIFTVFYTSMFTNGAGFFTGMVGSLGYWLAQQEVNRGGQPFYYYFLIQIPIYEYLPALGSLLAFVIALTRKHLTLPSTTASATDSTESGFEKVEQPPVLALIGFWSVTSLLAYTIAGEKMPWLTVHITLPMILTSAWAIGYLIETTNWKAFRQQHGWIVIGLLCIFIPALLDAIGSLLGNHPPFTGKTLEDLNATASFLISTAAAIITAIALTRVMKDWTSRQIRHISTLVFLAFLATLTARTAFTAAYIKYDLAEEYLVYAHCGPGPKIALAQIEEISRRTTGGLDMVVAYDSETTYPYWWYLRNFPNQRFYGNQPTRDLRDAPVILVGEDNFGKIEPVVGQAFYRFDYIRIWWPNMDYFGLTWGRIWEALTNPQMRAALFQIWLNRDYRLYAQVTGKNITLENWNPAERMRLYIRKDIVAKIWDYGTVVAPETIVADPYEGKEIILEADLAFGTTGNEPGQFQKPRGIAIAPDGSLYIADTSNHRIQHLAPDGTVLHVWGSFADASKVEPPASGGTFNEPWGIAVGPDGNVYVADTWNHRIQRFTPDGKFINMWGYFGTAETPFALWGPRGIATDKNGNVYVSDTGNKRIVIYDAKGNYITQFGVTGFGPGQFDEPVGIAVSADGFVYITDTWNQRIQVMIPDGAGGYYPLRTWEVAAWYGQSLDNKPYIAVDNARNIYVSDPEGYRILRFTSQGQFIHYWGTLGTGLKAFNLPTGLAIDASGGLWVVDSGNNRIMHFNVPQIAPVEPGPFEP